MPVVEIHGVVTLVLSVTASFDLLF